LNAWSRVRCGHFKVGVVSQRKATVYPFSNIITSSHLASWHRGYPDLPCVFKTSDSRVPIGVMLSFEMLCPSKLHHSDRIHHSAWAIQYSPSPSLFHVSLNILSKDLLEHQRPRIKCWWLLVLLPWALCRVGGAEAEAGLNPRAEAGADGKLTDGRGRLFCS
jgi:hypothetical protein